MRNIEHTLPNHEALNGRLLQGIVGKPKHTSNTSLAAELIQGFGAGEDGVHVNGDEVFQCFVKPKRN